MSSNTYNDLDSNTIYHDMESNKNIQLNIQAMRYLYIDDEEDSPPN